MHRQLNFGPNIVPLFMTWGPDLRLPGPIFFRKCVKRLSHRLYQMRMRCALPFLRYLRKISVGVASTPLAGRRLTLQYNIAISLGVSNLKMVCEYTIISQAFTQPNNGTVSVKNEWLRCRNLAAAQCSLIQCCLYGLYLRASHW